MEQDQEFPKQTTTALAKESRQEYIDKLYFKGQVGGTKKKIREQLMVQYLCLLGLVALTLIVSKLALALFN